MPPRKRGGSTARPKFKQAIGRPTVSRAKPAKVKIAKAKAKGPAAPALANANANARFKRGTAKPSAVKLGGVKGFSSAASKARLAKDDVASKSTGMRTLTRPAAPAPAKPASNPALDIFGGVSSAVNGLVNGIRSATNMGESTVSKAMNRR